MVTTKTPRIAPAGQVYVCSACGKRSRDKMGDFRIDSGWDVSCFMHAVLCSEKTLKFREGRVVSADPA